MRGPEKVSVFSPEGVRPYSDYKNIDYNNIVSQPVPEYLLTRLQRVQLAAAGFVLGRYAHISN